jgi:hypothetical protein
MIEEQPYGKGRRHRSRAEAEQIVLEYEASGLTQQEYCRRKGISAKTLARYLTRHRQAQAKKSRSQRWVTVEVAAQSNCSSELVLVLSNERRIEVKRGFDATTLRELVGVLEQR